MFRPLRSSFLRGGGQALAPTTQDPLCVGFRSFLLVFTRLPLLYFGLFSCLVPLLASSELGSHLPWFCGECIVSKNQLAHGLPLVDVPSIPWPQDTHMCANLSHSLPSCPVVPFIYIFFREGFPFKVNQPKKDALFSPWALVM